MILIVGLFMLVWGIKIGIEYVVADLFTRNRISATEAEEMYSWTYLKDRMLYAIRGY